jgi:hypothetical protein
MVVSWIASACCNSSNVAPPTNLYNCLADSWDHAPLPSAVHGSTPTTNSYYEAGWQPRRFLEVFLTSPLIACMSWLTKRMVGLNYSSSLAGTWNSTGSCPGRTLLNQTWSHRMGAHVPKRYVDGTGPVRVIEKWARPE